MGNSMLSLLVCFISSSSCERLSWWVQAAKLQIGSQQVREVQTVPWKSLVRLARGANVQYFKNVFCLLSVMLINGQRRDDKKLWWLYSLFMYFIYLFIWKLKCCGCALAFDFFSAQLGSATKECWISKCGQICLPQKGYIMNQWRGIMLCCCMPNYVWVQKWDPYKF